MRPSHRQPECNHQSTLLSAGGYRSPADPALHSVHRPSPRPGLLPAHAQRPDPAPVRVARNKAEALPYQRDGQVRLTSHQGAAPSPHHPPSGCHQQSDAYSRQNHAADRSQQTSAPHLMPCQPKPERVGQGTYRETA